MSQCSAVDLVYHLFDVYVGWTLLFFLCCFFSFLCCFVRINLFIIGLYVCGCILRRFVFDTGQRSESRVTADVRLRHRRSLSGQFQRRLRHPDIIARLLRQDAARQYRRLLPDDTPDRVSSGSQSDDHRHFRYVRRSIQRTAELKVAKSRRRRCLGTWW